MLLPETAPSGAFSYLTITEGHLVNAERFGGREVFRVRQHGRNDWRLVALGATLVEERSDSHCRWWVLADSEGNLFCLG